MDILKIVLMILFAIDCIALTAIVLMQEGKSAGLGAISGIADTYWGHVLHRILPFLRLCHTL